VKWLIPLLWVSAACGQPAAWWERRDDLFLFRTSQGIMEVDFYSASTFRVHRGPPGPPGHRFRTNPVDIGLTASADGGLQLETGELRVTVTRSGLLSVSLAGGHRLFAESAATFASGKFELALEVPAREQFFGFGTRPHTEADARGLVLDAATPFFVTGNGYAHWMATPGRYRYDVAKSSATRVLITADAVPWAEYYVAFGPSLKEIWEQRLTVVGAPAPPNRENLELISGTRLPAAATSFPQTDLCGDARALVHASLSGVPMPAFDLGHYANADVETYRRAARLGVFAPVLYESKAPADAARLAIRNEAASYRKSLSQFLLTYADEVRTRIYPVWHPLRHQFPQDPQAGARVDGAMFGDELLLFPVCDGSAQKTTYLPPGNWTDWNTGKAHRGRMNATLDVPPDGMIVLAKNGSIMPIGSGEVTELHYFPRLGGEFFFYEPEASDYSQVHAGPAADVYRVEIESKVDRRYEWVLHHMERPTGVEQVDKGPLPDWKYDPDKRTVRFVVDAPANSDIIHNILCRAVEAKP